MSKRAVSYSTMGFGSDLSELERATIALLASPRAIQTYLDGIAYRAESVYCCPLRVLRDRQAHCFDGALFAAACLRRLGHEPLVLEMVANDRDDGHMLALYQVEGHWGALAKSNFVGLRFREPVYRTLRELVMSYFEQYYNVEREKTLRAYSLPLNLAAFDHLHWVTQDESLEQIAARLDRARKIFLLKPAMEAELTPVDERLYQSGLLGANDAGLYKPTKHEHPKSRPATSAGPPL